MEWGRAVEFFVNLVVITSICKGGGLGKVKSINHRGHRGPQRYGKDLTAKGAKQGREGRKERPGFWP